MISDPNQRELDFGEIVPPALAVKAMRDSGYKNTAFALAELIDNSIQAEADRVELICVERKIKVGSRERKRISAIGVLDNGIGMDPSTLQMALQFGNGTHLEDRSGIGRFGMGLPNASISQCRRVDVWTWRAGPDNAIHTYLDLDEIESGKTRNVPKPEPSPVPDEWQKRTKYISERGTLIHWTGFEDHRLTWKSAESTIKHTESLSGRMYRKFLDSGQVLIRLAAYDELDLSSERLAEPNDPLYLIANSSTPEPFHTEPMFQKWGESDDIFYIEKDGNQYSVSVRFSWARNETNPKDDTDRGRTPYGRHADKNIGLSVIRQGRELELDPSWANGYDPRERWWGAEIEFPPELDEIFGVTNNKQHATVFNNMSKYDWKSDAEPGEEFMEYKRRLRDEGDPRSHLVGIVTHIKNQLAQIRKRLDDQTKGRRSKNRRHSDPSVEDRATAVVKGRAERGYRTESDDQKFDQSSAEQLVEDLTSRKKYEVDIAREISDAVYKRNRRVIFITSEIDSQSFFNVDVRPGGITEIIFNSRHPVYDKLIKTLDTDMGDATDSDLLIRIQNASDTLKLIFAAWARYEEEDFPNRDKISDMRHEWGKMAKDFIARDE